MNKIITLADSFLFFLKKGILTVLLTLNVKDLWPLFLLLQGFLQFGAEGHMVGVVEHDAHHLSR